MGSARPETASPSAVADRWRREPVLGASPCAATITNASSMTLHPGPTTIDTSPPGHGAPRRRPEPRRGSCSNPGTCYAWTTTGSFTAGSPTPGMIGSCTSCGPGATWLSGFPVPAIWPPPAARTSSRSCPGERFSAVGGLGCIVTHPGSLDFPQPYPGNLHPAKKSQEPEKELHGKPQKEPNKVLNKNTERRDLRKAPP